MRRRAESRRVPAVIHRLTQAETAVRRAEIARLAGEGVCGMDIAARLGLAVPTVHYHMKRLGLAYRGKVPQRGEKRAMIAALLGEGLRCPEIAARMGMNPKAVQDHINILQRAGKAERVHRPRDASVAAEDAALDNAARDADIRYRAQTRREAKACDALLDRLVALYGPPRFRGQPPAWAMRRADDGRAGDARGGQAGAGAA